MKLRLLAHVSLVAAALHAETNANSAANNDLVTFTERRIADLAKFPDQTWFDSIQTWLDSQKQDGSWSDVDYSSGCAAQRANWPIQQHWNRIITLAAAWSGANPAVAPSWTRQEDVLAAISKGLEYWFVNDYTPSDCMGDGGDATKKCPCETPGLWNTNWYDQAILIPQLCSTACLLLKNATLSDDLIAGCRRIPQRAYDLRDGTYGTGGRMTGSNAVLVMQNSVSLGLFTGNATIVQDAMDRALSVMTFTDITAKDGIHRDGSFLQHNGLLYNGNYGKDLLNAFIQLEGEAVGTVFAAKNATRETMATYVKGNEWMIFTEEKTRQEYWDFNVIGRFVAFPTRDLQASADINFNVTNLARATADFTGSSSVNDTITRLLSNGTAKLIGNKGFWSSDYMVHRREAFTVTNKMLSVRSNNSETVNGANPYAYHMGQGTLFSYVSGDEYKDIMAAWDWNLIPGTTVLLNHPNATSLTSVQISSRKSFVGVVSDGEIGIAVEDYVEPTDGSVSYKKAWFHFNDAVIVTLTDVKKSAAVTHVPVVTVLDNRARAAGGVWLDGNNIAATQQEVTQTNVPSKTLFYGGNGYLSYHAPFDLTISDETRTGNWSAISTSKLGVTSIPIFSAYATLPPGRDSMSFAVLPASSRWRLAAEGKRASWNPILTESGISAVVGENIAGVVFWPGGSKSITLQMNQIGWTSSKGTQGSVTIAVEQPGAYILRSKCGKTGGGMKLVMTLADPTQLLEVAHFSLTLNGGARWKQARSGEEAGALSKDASSVRFAVGLPAGGLAGSSVSRSVYITET